MIEYKITDIQLFDYAEKIQTSDDGDYEIQYSYSANLIINNSFVVEVWGRYSSKMDEFGFDGVADPSNTFWANEEEQEKALEEIDRDELEKALEESGFENNIGWIEDHATEIMNPENKQYRPV